MTRPVLTQAQLAAYLSHMEKVRLRNRHTSAQKIAAEFSAYVDSLQSRKRHEPDVARIAQPGKPHPDIYPPPVACSPGYASIVQLTSNYSYSSHEAPIHGPIAFTVDGVDFFKYGLKTVAADGSISAGIAALSRTVLDGDFTGTTGTPGTDGSSGILSSSVSGTIGHFFWLDQEYSNVSTTVRLTANQVLAALGFQADAPSKVGVPPDKNADDFTVASVTGICTVTLEAGIPTVGSRVYSVSSYGVFLNLGASSTNNKGTNGISVLDTPAATASYDWVSGGQGYMDISASLNAPSAQSIVFVDVDVSLQCLYYTSNEKLLRAGAWADLRRVQDIDLVTVPENLRAGGPLDVDSQIRVSSILLCGAT